MRLLCRALANTTANSPALSGLVFRNRDYRAPVGMSDASKRGWRKVRERWLVEVVHVSPVC